MKKLTILFILSLLFVKSNAQTIQNEYWTVGGMGWLVNNYLFTDDGLFIHNIGYSGGVCYIETFFGYYEYDPETNELLFDAIGEYAREMFSVKGVCETKIVIDSLTTNKVLLKNTTKEINIAKSRSYVRRKNFLTKEVWQYNSGDTTCCFTFYKNTTFYKDTTSRYSGFCVFEYNSGEYNFTYWAYCRDGYIRNSLNFNVFYIKDNGKVKVVEPMGISYLSI